MTLQSSGPLKASEIQAEFVGSGVFRLSDYYAGGPNVPVGTAGDGGPIPTSGLIRFSDFYGASNTAPVNLLGAFLLDVQIDPTDAGNGYRLSNAGTELARDTISGYSVINTWLVAGVVADYEARVTVVSGVTPSGSAVNDWLNLGTTRSWTLSQTSPGTKESKFTIEVRFAAGALIDSATVDMNINVDVI